MLQLISAFPFTALRLAHVQLAVTKCTRCANNGIENPVFMAVSPSGFTPKTILDGNCVAVVRVAGVGGIAAGHAYPIELHGTQRNDIGFTMDVHVGNNDNNNNNGNDGFIYKH